MKKNIIVLLLLLLVVPASYVSADVNWDWAWVISSNNRDVNGVESFNMQAGAGINTNAYDVYLKNPLAPDFALRNGGLYSPGIYQYNYGFRTPPSSIFVGSYTFYISDTGAIDDPTDKRVINFPSEGINPMPFVNVTNISGGLHPTVTWDTVTGADLYKFRIINPLNNAMLFDMTINKDINEYTYGENLFSQYDTLWINMEARDYLGSQWIRRSRSSYAHTVPEPATMLLLGLGLVGLAGIRRKLKN